MAGSPEVVPNVPRETPLIKELNGFEGQWRKDVSFPMTTAAKDQLGSLLLRMQHVFRDQRGGGEPLDPTALRREWQRLEGLQVLAKMRQRMLLIAKSPGMSDTERQEAMERVADIDRRNTHDMYLQLKVIEHFEVYCSYIEYVARHGNGVIRPEDEKLVSDMEKQISAVLQLCNARLATDSVVRAIGANNPIERDGMLQSLGGIVQALPPLEGQDTTKLQERFQQGYESFSKNPHPNTYQNFGGLIDERLREALGRSTESNGVPVIIPLELHTRVHERFRDGLHAKIQEVAKGRNRTLDYIVSFFEKEQKVGDPLNFEQELKKHLDELSKEIGSEDDAKKIIDLERLRQQDMMEQLQLQARLLENTFRTYSLLSAQSHIGIRYGEVPTEARMESPDGTSGIQIDPLIDPRKNPNYEKLSPVAQRALLQARREVVDRMEVFTKVLGDALKDKRIRFSLRAFIASLMRISEGEQTASREFKRVRGEIEKVVEPNNFHDYGGTVPYLGWPIPAAPTAYIHRGWNAIFGESESPLPYVGLHHNVEMKKYLKDLHAIMRESMQLPADFEKLSLDEQQRMLDAMENAVPVQMHQKLSDMLLKHREAFTANTDGRRRDIDLHEELLRANETNLLPGDFERRRPVSPDIQGQIKAPIELDPREGAVQPKKEELPWSEESANAVSLYLLLATEGHRIKQPMQVAGAKAPTLDAVPSWWKGESGRPDDLEILRHMGEASEKESRSWEVAWVYNFLQGEIQRHGRPSDAQIRSFMVKASKPGANQDGELRWVYEQLEDRGMVETLAMTRTISGAMLDFAQSIKIEHLHAKMNFDIARGYTVNWGEYVEYGVEWAIALILATILLWEGAKKSPKLAGKVIRLGGKVVFELPYRGARFSAKKLWQMARSGERPTPTEVAELKTLGRDVLETAKGETRADLGALRDNLERHLGEGRGEKPGDRKPVEGGGRSAMNTPSRSPADVDLEGFERRVAEAARQVENPPPSNEPPKLPPDADASGGSKVPKKPKKPAGGPGSTEPPPVQRIPSSVPLENVRSFELSTVVDMMNGRGIASVTTKDGVTLQIEGVGTDAQLRITERGHSYTAMVRNAQIQGGAPAKLLDRAIRELAKPASLLRAEGARVVVAQVSRPPAVQPVRTDALPEVPKPSKKVDTNPGGHTLSEQRPSIPGSQHGVTGRAAGAEERGPGSDVRSANATERAGDVGSIPRTDTSIGSAARTVPGIPGGTVEGGKDAKATGRDAHKPLRIKPKLPPL